MLRTILPRLARMALLALLAAGPGMAPAPAAAQQSAAVPQSALQRLAAHRAAAGVPPLRRDARLEAAARSHALWMARTGRYGHEGRGGTRMTDRARAAGYCYRALAENIAFGMPGADQVIEGWMGSPSHRRNALSGALSDFGLAGADGYWVMLIGRAC